jgi:hypothetical protein
MSSLSYCWPTRTRTLNKTTKMSCVTITPSAKTVNSGAKVMRLIHDVKLLRKKLNTFYLNIGCDLFYKAL